MFVIIAWPISLLFVGVIVFVFTERSAYDRGHREGYDSGVTVGKDQGYTIGEKFGYAHGSAEGRVLGEKDGRERAAAEANANERALQELHRQTVAKLSTPAAQAEKPAKASKPARIPKRGNGSRAPKR